MPTPRRNESKDDFISRCIPMVVNEGRSQEQASAICYSIWDESKKNIIQVIWERLFKKTKRYMTFPSPQDEYERSNYERTTKERSERGD